MAVVEQLAPSRLGSDELTALHREYMETRDPELQRRLLDVHSGLAYRVATRFANRGEAMDDLCQVAFLGLVKAINGFDPDRGLRFSTYAMPTILGELKRYFRDRGWAVRLPRRIHDLYLNVQGAVDELTQELGRSPTITDIGERVGVSEEDVVAALEAGGLRRSSSLEATLNAEDSRSLAATFGAEDPQLAHLERALTLGVLLERLPELERQIVHLRFVEGMTQLEIARRVGRSQMQISRMLARSLGRLRAWADDTRRSAGSSSA